MNGWWRVSVAEGRNPTVREGAGECRKPDPKGAKERISKMVEIGS